MPDNAAGFAFSQAVRNLLHASAGVADRRAAFYQLQDQLDVWSKCVDKVQLGQGSDKPLAALLGGVMAKSVRSSRICFLSRSGSCSLLRAAVFNHAYPQHNINRNLISACLVGVMEWLVVNMPSCASEYCVECTWWTSWRNQQCSVQ